MPLTAVILAGGQSRRMGADKALLRLPSGGPTLIERVVAAARAVTNDVVVVAQDAGRLPTMAVRTAPDAIAGGRAAGGSRRRVRGGAALGHPRTRLRSAVPLCLAPPLDGGITPDVGCTRSRAPH